MSKRRKSTSLDQAGDGIVKREKGFQGKKVEKARPGPSDEGEDVLGKPKIQLANGNHTPDRQENISLPSSSSNIECIFKPLLNWSKEKLRSSHFESLVQKGTEIAMQTRSRAKYLFGHGFKEQQDLNLRYMVQILEWTCRI